MVSRLSSDTATPQSQQFCVGLHCRVMSDAVILFISKLRHPRHLIMDSISNSILGHDLNFFG